VEAESLGSLDSALQLYRRAFKLDSNVDRAYHRAQATASAQETSSITSTARATVLPVVATELSSTTNNNLAALLATFSPDLLEFTAENEELGVPLEQIPLELIVLILRELARVKDVTSLERFGASSRKARVISVDSTIWR
jgi:F-box protein 9